MIYINGLPQTLSSLSETTIFADDTNAIIYSKKFYDFHPTLTIVVYHVSKWFSYNKLALNLDKINVIKFITNNSP
jgi:hypothetical protein